MSDLPHPWGVYSRLQSALARRRHVDSLAWGLEAGLHLPLTEDLPADEDIDRAIRSASRKERHRARLRLSYPMRHSSPSDLESAVDARRSLHLLRTLVTRDEWALLRAVGEGHEYKDIAEVAKVAPGALRARVLRLRRALTSVQLQTLAS